MADAFRSIVPTLEAPASRAAGVTPNDSSDLSTSARALYIGGTGDVKVDTTGGDTVTFKAVPIGFMPVRVSRVHATGTTATEIIAVW